MKTARITIPRHERVWPLTDERLHQNFLKAVRQGDVVRVEGMLIRHKDLSTYVDPRDHWTYLHEAAGWEQIGVMEVLLRKRSWILPRDKDGRTPLDVAYLFYLEKSIQFLEGRHIWWWQRIDPIGAFLRWWA